MATVPASRLLVRTAAVLLLLCFATLAAAQHHGHNRHDPRALAEDPRLAPGQLAPVLEGLGDHHHEVTTRSERAQQFFDQGLKLTYGFNHQEALRAFKEAARLDPDCAMAYWGWALVLGPNLNLPMRAEAVPQAWEAVRLAVAHKDKVSERERDYIEALAKRYAENPGDDRSGLDRAYADAMRALHEKYPDDLDAATLYAAALMNLSPWDYWTPEGEPKENTATVLATLEAVIARDPHHEGALHYSIHAVEPVDAPRGEAAADALRGLAPGAGHLVHMPSHIYMQVGRYAEAYEANTLAVQADEGYITQCRAQGIYPLNYYPHNIHFLAWAAIMQGRSKEALGASRKVAAAVPRDMLGNDWGLFETFLSMPLYTMVRFGMWDTILDEPRPGKNTPYFRSIWHYARGMARVHGERPGKAAKDVAAIERLLARAPAAETMIGFANARTLLTIARDVLAGELAAKQGRLEDAIRHLEAAVELEDGLLYNEPPDWYYPVRHTLGAVLLEAGRPAHAEAVYRRDLKRNRDNGFALFGLVESLKRQGKTEEAARLEAKLRTVWADADVQLASSRF